VDEISKKILNRLQGGIPLTTVPFKEMADEIGISEENFIKETKNLFEQKIIREIGPIFETEEMGHISTLVACEVDPSRIEKVAEFVGAHPGVTHNYQREDRFNLWFTLTIPKEVSIERTLSIIELQKGVKRVMNLPKDRVYKIRVVFDLDGGEVEDRTPKRDDKNRELNIPRGIFIRMVNSLQSSFPLVREPFSELAKEAKLPQDQFMANLKEMFASGVIRRFPAMLSHRKAGISHNLLIAWIVKNEDTDNLGKAFAEFPFVSHCYRRKTYNDWPYNLYTMTHARSLEEWEGNFNQMKDCATQNEHLVLKSLKEYKKTRVKYFSPELDKWNKKYL